MKLNKVVEEVTEFIYLGSKVTENGNSEEDINNKITKANQAFAMLYKIWKSKKAEHKNQIKDI